MFLKEKSRWTIADGTEYVYGLYLMFFTWELAAGEISDGTPIRALVRSIKMEADHISTKEICRVTKGICRIKIPSRKETVILRPTGMFGSDGLPMNNSCRALWTRLHRLPTWIVSGYWLASPKRMQRTPETAYIRNLRTWAAARKDQLKYLRKRPLND